MLISTDPASGSSAWQSVYLGEGRDPYNPGPFGCLSTKLCVGTDSKGDLITSTNPAGGAMAWQEFIPPDGDMLGAPTCFGTSLCFSYGGLSGNRGAVWFSTHPAGGAPTWQARTINFAPFSYTCPSAKLCIGPWPIFNSKRPVPSTGVITTTTPIAGENAWTVTRIRTPLPGAACPVTWPGRRSQR